MPDYTLKQHDTYPPLVADLVDTDGAIDLSEAVSVRLLLRSKTLSIITDPVEIVVPETLGRIRYEWQPGDTDVAGVYRLEFEITWDVGVIETVPNDGYKELVIMEDLG